MPIYLVNTVQEERGRGSGGKDEKLPSNLWIDELSTRGTIICSGRDAHVEQVAKWWASGGGGPPLSQSGGPAECKGM